MSTQESQRLTARILEATKSGHAKTDKLAQIRSVTALRDARLYRKLLRDFWAVYQSFEEAWQTILQTNHAKINKDNNLARVQKLLADVWMPELARTASFEADIEFYYKEDAQSLLQSNTTSSKTQSTEVEVARQALKLAGESMSPAAKVYKIHIADTAANDPIRLLAYAYTMYSAITAGGQILRSRLIKHLLFFEPSDELKPELPHSILHSELILNGQQIFDFYPANITTEDTEDWRQERPIQRKKLRVELKRRLDDLELTESEIDAVIDEANCIFANNAKVLSEASEGAGWYILQWGLTWGAVTAALATTVMWLISNWKR
ncbi:hypothetical protein BDF19DRAFT_423905 [Syncephalis fuscata]|nr:hypothetical protein BDF19DRAFT_423905 [Syncephalis fuscata]